MVRGVLLVALLLAAATGARAGADGPDTFRVVGVGRGDVLNLRGEPSASAAVVARIPPGATGLRNFGCRGGLTFAQWEAASEGERAAGIRRRWCRVEYRGTTGWVAGRYVAE